MKLLKELLIEGTTQSRQSILDEINDHLTSMWGFERDDFLSKYKITVPTVSRNNRRQDDYPKLMQLIDKKFPGNKLASFGDALKKYSDAADNERQSRAKPIEKSKNTPIGLPKATEDQYDHPVRGVAYETESGWFGVTADGKFIKFENSGYKQTFSVADFKKALQTKRLITKDELDDMKADGMSAKEIQQHIKDGFAGWEINDGVIENPDEMHYFDPAILRKLIE